MRLTTLASAVVLTVSTAAIAQVASTPVEPKTGQNTTASDNAAGNGSAGNDSAATNRSSANRPPVGASTPDGAAPKHPPKS